MYPITLNNKIKAKDLSKKLMKVGIETRPFLSDAYAVIIKKLKLVKKMKNFQFLKKYIHQGYIYHQELAILSKNLTKL